MRINFVRLDDVEVHLPYHEDHVTIISDNANAAWMYIHPGVEISLIHGKVDIKISDVWTDKTLGMCGIFNRRSSDDLKLSFDDSLPTLSHKKFISAWRTAKVCLPISRKFFTSLSISRPYLQK